MSRTNRLVVFLLFLVVVLFLGLVYKPFVDENIIRPTALVVWLLLRLFILSIGQKIYWGALIFAALLLAIRRLSREQKQQQQFEQSDPNATLRNYQIWRTFIRLTDNASEGHNTLKQDLEKLLVSMYAHRRRGTAYYEVREALAQRQIQVPEQVYAFLLADDPANSHRTLKMILQGIWQAPGKWIRRWSGRDQADYHQAIDEVLTFMETTLEIEYDDDPFDPRNHRAGSRSV